MKYTLTNDQKKAAEKFLGFLLSPEKEFYLFGSAGCGKTYLLSYLLNKTFNTYEQMCKVIDKEPMDRRVFLTAPTNKALEVLSNMTTNYKDGWEINCKTIYSYLNISVWDDLKTGESKLKFPSVFPYSTDCLIVIDECSMLPSIVRKLLLENCSDTVKILYIGDNYQLPPVKEKPIWEDTPKAYTTFLNTPVRNKGHQPLIDLCEQLKESVKTQEFKPIHLVPGSIELLDDAGAMNWLTHADFSKKRVLAYTNYKSIRYIKLIEDARSKANFIRANEFYINNGHYEINYRRGLYFYADELVKVEDISPIAQFYPEYGLSLLTGMVSSASNPKKVVNCKIAPDPQALKGMIKVAAKAKNWPWYFRLKNEVMDLRFPYASTIHKSQGSTFDEVLVDLGSFRTCKNPEIAARLLYVAVSRAKHKVYFYGKLPKKYGELDDSQLCVQGV